MEVDSRVKAGVLSDVFAQLVRVSLSEKVVEALSSAQVTYAQFEALRYIQSNPHTTVGDLSAGLNISYPSATNMVSRLNRKGLLLKKGLRADRRIVRLALTTSGDNLVNEVRDERGNRLSEIMRAMRARDREAFTAALDSFLIAAARCGYADQSKLALYHSDEKEDPALAQIGSEL